MMMISNSVRYVRKRKTPNLVINEMTQANFPAVNTPEEGILEENNVYVNHGHLDARYTDE